MTQANQPFTPADLVDGDVPAVQRAALLAADPQLAAEVEVAERVRALLIELRAAEIAVPNDFERRLIARVQGDRTALDLIDLGLAGAGRALLELLDLIFGLLPAPQPAAS